MLKMAILPPFIAMLLAPLLLGTINKVKSLFAGRRGPSPLQPYRDLFKLLQKGKVISHSSSWIFYTGPTVQLSVMLLILWMLPLGGQEALLHFEGDLFLLAALLGLARFWMVLAALDTGSSFEGMGASRELSFSSLAEPALLLALLVVCLESGQLSLSEMFGPLHVDRGPAMVLVFAALLIVFLTENSRIPVDDPNTHLELTMIHEVMVLDHSGPDLALIEYAASLKMWILGTLCSSLFLPALGSAWLSLGLAVLMLFALACLVGAIESLTARYRLSNLPQFLVAAAVLAALALFLVSA